MQFSAVLYSAGERASVELLHSRCRRVVTNCNCPGSHSPNIRSDFRVMDWDGMAMGRLLLYGDQLINGGPTGPCPLSLWAVAAFRPVAS
jgi:hypothetical protein